jgi:hypothetical protein
MAPAETKKVDALSRDSGRYSVKTVYPDHETKNKQCFEFLLIIRLDSSWELLSIFQLIWNDFVKVQSLGKRMNAWYVAMPKHVWNLGRLVHQVQPDKK